MPTALIALALLGGVLEIDPDGRFGFDRVDVLSEDPGTWIHYDLPYAGTYATTPAIRFVAQVKPVWRTPVRGLYVGTSLASQSAVLERPLLLTDCHGLYASLGLQTRLLLPAGLMGGVAWRYGPLRVGAGVSLVSTASWRHRNWTQWQLLPTLGVGIGRRYQSPEF